MSIVRLPVGLQIEPLQHRHPRWGFLCGELGVDDWLKTKALQQQEKHLSVTKVLKNP
jgi:hypothetical protein